jgi:hypothetical protein
LIERIRKWIQHLISIGMGHRALPQEKSMQREEGFLSQEIDDAVAEAHRRFAPWFAVIADINRLAMTVLYTIRVNHDDNRKLCEATLFSKAVQASQAAVLLAERGMPADARTVLRTATETALFQRKVKQDAAFVSALEENHDHHRYKQASAMLDDPQAAAQMSPRDAEVFTKVVMETKTQYATGLPKKVVTFEVAKSVKYLGFYNTIFRPTSDDSAHPSIRSMGRHTREDDKGRFSLVFGPQDEDMENTLFSVGLVLLDVTTLAIDSFSLEPHVPEALRLQSELSRVPGIS